MVWLHILNILSTPKTWSSPDLCSVLGGLLLLSLLFCFDFNAKNSLTGSFPPSLLLFLQRIRPGFTAHLPTGLLGATG